MLYVPQKLRRHSPDAIPSILDAYDASDPCRSDPPTDHTAHTTNATESSTKSPTDLPIDLPPDLPVSTLFTMMQDMHVVVLQMRVMLTNLSNRVTQNSDRLEALEKKVHTTRQTVADESIEVTKSVTECVTAVHQELQSLRRDTNRLSAHVHKMSKMSSSSA